MELLIRTLDIYFNYTWEFQRIPLLAYIYNICK